MSAFMERDYAAALALFKNLPSRIPRDYFLADRLEVMGLFSEASVYAAEGNYEAAIQTAKKILSLSVKHGFSDEEIKAYAMLSDFSAQSGDDTAAKDYIYRYYHKKDSTLTEREITTISKMPLVTELEKMNHEIQNERREKRQVLMAGMVGAVIVILIIVYLITLIRNHRKLKSYVRSIYRKNVELIKSVKREREQRKLLEEKRLTEASSDSGPERKYANSAIPEDLSSMILNKILTVLQDTEAICEPHFTLHQLAELTGYSYKQVSQIINDKLKKNFKTLLNEYRIQEACTRLLDREHYGQYTIEHIAKSVGFNSRSNFSVTFKAVTGITPSEFLNNAIAESQERAGGSGGGNEVV